jgi:60 kDa SS-A/Ro ribonucleoprotein
MAINYRNEHNTRKTPQSEAIPGTVKNSAGGYSYGMDKWGRLERFLVLGSEGGTYYVSQRKLSVENAKSAGECIKEDGIRVVDLIVDISDKARAASNDPALYVLAMCTASEDLRVRSYALAKIPEVARIGTHLMHFAEYLEGFRGWGRAVRNGFGAWFTDKEPDNLAYQAIKYKQRDGWSLRDILRLSHPEASNVGHAAVFDWICRGTENDFTPGILKADVSTKEAAIKAIVEFNMPREALPTELLKDKEVWEAMLPKMPMTAMVRNLGVMTARGLFEGGALNKNTKIVVAKFNEESVRKSRVHPLALITALYTYKQGRGTKGSLTWSPVGAICDALDEAFYMAFENVEPTGKNFLLALDVSGSMSAPIGGSPLNCREASSVMAMVTAKSESNYDVVGFTGGGWSRDSNIDNLKRLDITPKQRLDDIVRSTSRLPFGGTNCALPMLYATKKGLDVDAFVIYTDSETWAGDIHPMQALKEYRKKANKPDAKLIVVGMASNGFTIGDPEDRNCLDIVGFDTNTPQVISNFVRG